VLAGYTVVTRLWGIRPRRRAAFAVLVAVLAVVGGWDARPALAHAELARSEPAANSVVPDAPPALQLWFTERPEPRFSEVAVYDGARNRLPGPPLQVAPGDRDSLYLALGPLPPGTYTVVWKVLSADDGHTSAGAFAFAVGVGQTVTGPVVGVTSAAVLASQATPWTTFVRWLTYVSTAGLLGALAFVPLVLEPALGGLRGAARGGAPRPETADEPWPDAVRLAMTRRVLRLAGLSLWAAAGATVLAALAQAAEASGVPLWRTVAFSADAPLGALLLGTRYGQVWLGRAGLLVLLAVAASRLRPTRRPPRGRARALWAYATGAAALVALTTSLGSHAAAGAPAAAPLAPLLPVVADWVHLVAAGLWVGGLAQLVLALPAGVAAAGPARRTALVAALVAAFSSLAVACVAALLLTGLYQSLLHVASWGALFGTTYGRALAVKLALAAPLLFLGGFNLLVARPGLARAAAVERLAGRGRRRGVPPVGGRLPDGHRLLRAFRLAVRAELGLAAGVLAAVAVMTSSPPAKDAWADLTRGVTQERVAGDLRLTLRVDPGEAGFNTFALRVREARSGRPVADAEKVALVVTMVEMDMGENELVLEPLADGWYQTQSGRAAMGGTLRAEAVVGRRGEADVRSQFAFGLAPPAAPVAGGAPVAPAGARFLRNPLPPTAESLAIGQQLYTQNCLVCHGAQGQGDGPAARGLRPPPADLTVRVPQRAEGELFWFVANGVPGTAMRAWGALTDADLWAMVSYLRSAFGPKTP
jgi:copper transport protein